MNYSKSILFAAIFSSLNAFSQPVDLVKRAESNDPRAQFELGQLYANGDGLPKNSSEAIKWLNKSAASNTADAIARIGIMYAEGDGFQKDESKAIEFYKRAIQLGGNRGMVAYARALVRGDGTKKNLPLAHSLLKTAVENNSPAAMFVLGSYYKSQVFNGSNGEQLIASSADRGYVDAIVENLTNDIREQTDPTIAKSAFEKLLKYKGKFGYADYGIIHYYLNFTKPPSIEAAKELAKPYLDTDKFLAYIMMAEISYVADDYVNSIHYMSEANVLHPGSFDIKSAKKEYSIFIERKQKQEAEIARQKEFIAATTKAQGLSASAQNDMQRGGIKAERDNEICKIMQNKNVERWVGYVSNLSANSDGFGVLSVAVAQDVTLKTWNNSMSDTGANTLISPESALFKKASKMNVGQKVAFSGTFFKSNSRECLREASLSLGGALRAPEYIFRFSDITAIQ